MTTPNLTLQKTSSLKMVLPLWKRLLQHIEWRLALMPIIGIVLYIVWRREAESGRHPAFILPHPNQVYERFMTLWENGTLVDHTATTLWEAMAGLGIATLIALPLGYTIARLRLFDYLLTPYLIFLQAIPVIAIAPLIIIWFEAGIQSKIVISAMITWFPLMIATIIGIRNVSPNLREMMRANVANPLQMFWHLEAPSALPEILGGLKIAVTLSVIGAAVGEFVSSREGLGYLVIFGRSTSDTPLVFVAVLLLTAISLTLYSLIGLLEHALLDWKRAGK